MNLARVPFWEKLIRRDKSKIGRIMILADRDIAENLRLGRQNRFSGPYFKGILPRGLRNRFSGLGQVSGIVRTGLAST
jgi:hypothetical protein